MMPVYDADFALPQRVIHSKRDEAKFAIEILRIGGIEDLQAAFYSQTRCDNEDILGKLFVLIVGDFVEDLPCDKHGHNDGLAGTCGHFRAKASEWSAIAGDF